MKILTDKGLVAFWNKIKQLVLGNRPYNPSEFSGKGYKVLEKNIQTVGGVKKNILTAVMLSKANTIYEIRYDFDLGGKTIEMKEGCILKFEGGILYNGKIKGNNTKVEANITRIFGEYFLLEGTFDVAEGYAEWFGAQSDGINDDRYSIQCAINSFDIVRLLNKGYLIDSLSDNINKIALIVPVGKSIRGSYNRQPYENDIVRTIRLGNNIVPKKIIELAGKNYIGNIGISGNSKNNDTISQVGIGTVDDTSRIKLEMIAIDNTYYGIDICAWETILTQCSCSYNTVGIRVKGVFNNSTLKTQETSTTLINCYVGSSLGYAYYIHGMTYSTLINCSADNCGWGIDKGTISDSTAKQIFAIQNCRSISLINCACEYGVKVAYITSSEHIVFDNCNFLLKSDGLENDFAYTKVIDFRYSNDVKFRNCIISGTDLSSKKWIYSENENKHKSLLNIVDCNFPFKKSLYFITSNVTFGYQESIESIAVLTTCNRSINSRFTPSPMDIGVSYFDKSLNPPRPIWWTGEKWINADGTDIQ